MLMRIILFAYIFLISNFAFARIEKHIQIDEQRGIKAVLVSPVYDKINHQIKNDALEFLTLKEKFIYTQEQDGEATLLKEWIEAEEPNSKTGSTYIWQITPIDTQDKIRLTKFKNQIYIQLFFPPLNGEGRGGVNEGWQNIAQINPIIYFDKNNKESKGELTIDGNKVIVTVKARKDQYPLRIDPSIRYGQWLGGQGGPVTAKAVVYNSANSTVLFSGSIATPGDMALPVSMTGVYNGSSEGFIIQVAEGGTPSINWGQWIGGNGTDQVTSLAVNGTAIYAAGGSTASTQFTTLNFQGTHNGLSEAFIIKLTDGGTPTINWGQWIGGNSNDSFNALVINGSVIYAAGSANNSTNFTTITFNGTSNGFADGMVIKITDGGTPTINWGQWIGGDFTDAINTIGINGSSLYIGGTSSRSTKFTTLSFQGTFNPTGGNPMGFVIKMSDGGTPSLNWGQWIGGSTATAINSLSVSGASIYVAGGSITSTSFTTMTFQGTNNGASDGFVIKLTDGGTPTINWGQWIGGNGSDILNSIVVNGTTIFAAGTASASTNFTTMSFQGVYIGPNEGIVISITDGGTPTINWGQWIGGLGTDTLNAITNNASAIYLAGQSSSKVGFTTLTFQGTHFGNSEGMVIKMTDGGTPTFNWGQWMGGGSAELAKINALSVGSGSIFAAGFASQTRSFEALTFQGTFNGLSDAFIVKLSDGGTPSINWGQWVGGSGNESFTSIAVNGTSIYAAGFAGASTNFTTLSFQGTYNGGQDAMLVKVTDGGTPTINWGQWVGSNSTDSFNALAVNGTSIYAAGSVGASTNFATLTFQGTYNGGSESMVIKLTDGGTPTFNWGQWIGGTGTDNFNALAVNGTSVYAAGSMGASTNFTTLTFQGGYGGGQEGMVIKLTDGGTPTINWGQRIGGNSTDTLNAIIISGNTIIFGGNSFSNTSYTAITFQGTYSSVDGMVIKMTDGGTPSVNWGQWLGGSSGATVTALNINGTAIYAAGGSSQSTNFETLAFLAQHNGISEGFLIKILDGGSPTIHWGQWIGGTGNDSTAALAFDGTNLYIGGSAASSTNFTTLTFQGTMISTSEAFLISITEESTSRPKNLTFIDYAF